MTRAKRGRFITYDKQLVLYEIVQGRMSAQQIADKHGITRGMVYSLKHAAKKQNLIKEPAQRLSDLDPVERRQFRDGLPHEIYQLACRFKDETITGLEFYKDVQNLLDPA